MILFGFSCSLVSMKWCRFLSMFVHIQCCAYLSMSVAVWARRRSGRDVVRALDRGQVRFGSLHQLKAMILCWPPPHIPSFSHSFSGFFFKNNKQ